MAHKTCSRCGLHKPLTDFYVRRDDGRGHQTHRASCKACRPKKTPEQKEKVRQQRATLEFRAKIRAERSTPGGKARRRGYTLKEKFGLTLEDFERMLAVQNGACAICGCKEPGGVGNQFHVDHDHTTGAIRQLLCSNCNRGLGHFQENVDLLEAAIVYLKKHSV